MAGSDLDLVLSRAASGVLDIPKGGVLEKTDMSSKQKSKQSK